jgi:radical SAM protein (TIGR01212 family)
MNTPHNTLNPFGKNRYNSYRDYLHGKYGERIQKVTVDAGFTCPNRDGNVAIGGCIYCNNESFNPRYNNPLNSIRQQIKQGIIFLKRRYKVSKFIVYFQPYSNTYASLDKLKKMFEEALSFPEVIGLTIGTRPDCVDEEKINYLHELGSSYDITIEYGLESIYDESLKRINRGHDYQSFVDAINITKGKGITICTHMILGFPWESKNEWLNEANVLSALPIDFLKVHQLHIVKDTVMAKQYDNKQFSLLSYNGYIDIVVSFLELLNPEIIIQRLCGEAPPHLLIAPRWGKRNSEILQAIKIELEHRDTWQGKYYKA